MNKILFVLTSITILSGCMTTGVLPIGNGTYHIGVDSISSMDAKGKSIKNAIEFCSKKGKEMIVIEGQNVSYTEYSLTFKCK